MPDSCDARAVVTEIQQRVNELGSMPALPLSKLTEFVQHAHKIADEWESQGRLADALEIYEEINKAYEVAMEQVDPSERDLLASFRDFWRAVVETKRQRMAQEHQASVVQTIARDSSLHASIKEGHFQQQTSMGETSFSITSRSAHSGERVSRKSEFHRKMTNLHRKAPRSSTLDGTNT